MEKGKHRRRLAILVGGGPAPGINGVISAATIEAVNRDLEVMGIYDGFQWLMDGNTEHTVKLNIEDVSRIHFNGGSILRTSRANPTKRQVSLDKCVESLLELDVDYLMTIGGDDTAYSASRIADATMGRIRVAHVPKTIDNDLPLPSYTPTFGYSTARHVGVQLTKNIMEDAQTTNRWYFLVTMGRNAGHLALGIGKAAGVTLTIIAEEFPRGNIRFAHVCDILEGAIIKRLAAGRAFGVAVLAEGISERLDPSELNDLQDVERDEHGHIRLSEIDLGKQLKNEVRKRLSARGIMMTVVGKNIGYELRCAPPIPFDCEYTRDLGYGAVRFLLAGGSSSVISIEGGRLQPIPFVMLVDPKTGRPRIRYVEVNTESYEVARQYMIRLNAGDFNNPETLEQLAQAGHMSAAEFKSRFGYLGKYE